MRPYAPRRRGPLPSGSTHTIRKRTLRSRTGATLVAVQKGSAPLVSNPDPKIVLEPGDLAMLLGSLDQLAAAARLFAAEGVEEPEARPWKAPE
ncbi:MAG: TrkA C-terminal domain-containing protein [Thermodesulfobacteriota bacterium]